MPRTQVSSLNVERPLHGGNRLTSDAMDGTPTLEAEPLAVTHCDPFASRNTAAIAGVLILICGSAFLAIASAGTGAPVMLTCLGILAALGVFFLFGFIAGHIRIAERTTTYDLLSHTFDRSDLGLVLTGPDGCVRRANEAAAELLGAASVDRLALLEDAFGGEPKSNAVLFRLSRAVERGLSRTEDLFVAGPGGLRPGRWLRVSAKPLEAGAIESDLTGTTLWTLIDITRDRAREHQACARLERRLAIMEQMPAGMLVFDAAGRLEYMSTTAAQWLGHDEETPLRELTKSDVFTAEAWSEITVENNGAHRAPAVIDADLINADETLWPATLVRWSSPSAPMAGSLDVAAAPHIDERTVLLVLPRGSVTAAQATAPADATAARAPTTRLLRSAPFGVATVTSTGLIAETNTTFTRLTADAGSVTGRSAVDVLCDRASPDHNAAVKQALDHALAGKANIAPVDVTVGQDGALARRLFFVAAPQSDAGDHAAIVYVLDATEQKALELKFAQSQKMEVVGKLAGGIAHDFNNDLTSIIGFSDLLLGTHRPGDPAFPNINNIRSSATHAAELVRNLLAFSRQQQLQPKVLDVHETITDQTLLLKSNLHENINFVTRSARDLWYVKADAGELRRVIQNLTGNAADAMPDGGELTIRTRNVTEREASRLNDIGLPTGEYVLIEVSDTGCGMTPEVMEKIFEPFFTTKSVDKGTGLGLSTVHGVIASHRAALLLESQTREGTVFKVYFPLSDDEIDVEYLK